MTDGDAVPGRMAAAAPRPIVLDCDPGHDDALAIMLAAGDPRVDLLGVTTVAGNQTVEKTTHNACAVATVAGLIGLDVAAGCDRPLLRELTTAPGIHGASGMDGPPPVVPSVSPVQGHAVDFLIGKVMEAPGEVTIVATAPLTNVALALRREPAIAAAVREVVIMGGAFGRGNVTPAAEFNIFVDPEAAAIVFGAPWPVTMMGLDVTHQATCTRETQARIGAIGSPVATFATQLIDYFRSTYQREQSMDDPPVHDACAVAYVADPSLFNVRPALVEIETKGEHTSGMTVTTFMPEGASARHHIGTSLRREAFWDAVIRAIAALGSA
ncbi:MAG: nucleoside hydrolase [Acidimicrobiales bacterium]